MQAYEPLLGAFFNREFPTSWRQIDLSVDKMIAEKDEIEDEGDEADIAVEEEEADVAVEEEEADVAVEEEEVEEVV